MPMSQEELDTMYKGIEESNAAFFAMSREEKRVQLAKDALLQLQMGRFFPFSVYFAAPTGSVATPLGYHPERNEEVQAVLKRMPECEVCGIGALFVVAIDRLNALKVSDFIGDSMKIGIHRYLEAHDLFSRDELLTIEDFFEGASPVMLSKSKRMHIIMNAIIRNKGEGVTRTDLLNEADIHPEKQA